MIEAITPGGKTVKAVRDLKTAAYKFQFVPGGELPEELTGIFTDERSAKVALARYLEKAINKSKKNV